MGGGFAAPSPLFQGEKDVWLLTTRGRPGLCQEVLDNCGESEGLVFVDGPISPEIDEAYQGLVLPPNWDIHFSPENVNIVAAMNWFYEQNPSLGYYGWMSDDCIPLSDNWWGQLIEAAGDWNLAYPDDGWMKNVHPRHGGPHVSSIMCFGGELVRAMGTWAPGPCKQLYNDDVWEAVCTPLGLMKYCPHVLADHKHHANGKRGRDETDNWNDKAADKERWKAWNPAPLLAKVREAHSA